MGQFHYRDKYRLGLADIYLPLYDKLCEILDETWQPYSGLRGFLEQESLWMKGRTLPGAIVTNARGGESPHCYGCASDWTCFNNSDCMFYWPPKTADVWNIYRDAIDQAGARWGGSWGDMVHNELPISKTWGYVKSGYDSNGMIGAMEFIKEHREEL